MNDYIDSLLERYVGQGLLIDANLLLLDIVGSYNPRLVGDAKYKKLAMFTLEDFNILTRLKSMFENIVTTPHVLTEVSNLTGDLPENTRRMCFAHFPSALKVTSELTFDSFKLFNRSEFTFLGLTDTGLAEVAHEYLIVTDDARMVGLLNDNQIEALNFNHLRTYLLLPE